MSRLVKNLQSKEYRDAFVSSQINITIPFQIRALRKARSWTQQQLADRAGMTQARIAVIESPGSKLTLNTLRRLASAFDCGLRVHFAPFSEMVDWSENFSPDEFRAPEFADDSFN